MDFRCYDDRQVKQVSLISKTRLLDVGEDLAHNHCRDCKIGKKGDDILPSDPLRIITLYIRNEVLQFFVSFHGDEDRAASWSLLHTLQPRPCRMRSDVLMNLEKGDASNTRGTSEAAGIA